MSSPLTTLSEFVLSSIIFLEIHFLDFIHKKCEQFNFVHFMEKLQAVLPSVTSKTK